MEKIEEKESKIFELMRKESLLNPLHYIELLKSAVK